MCPYLFVCSFDLSVWYQVFFDMICLHGTSFCILCSFLFGLLFLYMLVLNVSQLFFVYPFLFQFHPCFLCFSISIIFFFLHSSKGFPILVYPFLFLFFLCFPLKKSIVQLHHFVYKHVTIGANQVGYQYKNQNQVAIISKFWKFSFCCQLSICLIKTSETGWLFKIFCLKVLNL